MGNALRLAGWLALSSLLLTCGGNKVNAICVAPRQTCGELCADLKTSDAHCGACGAVCSGNTGCAGGACLPKICGAVTCPDGQVCANDVCMDKSCVGIACAAGEVCEAGACLCPDRSARCNNLCVKIATDDHNCGACSPSLRIPIMYLRC